jgi:hypothetical protein
VLFLLADGAVALPPSRGRRTGKANLYLSLLRDRNRSPRSSPAMAYGSTKAPPVYSVCCSPWLGMKYVVSTEYSVRLLPLIRRLGKEPGKTTALASEGEIAHHPSPCGIYLRVCLLAAWLACLALCEMAEATPIMPRSLGEYSGRYSLLRLVVHFSSSSPPEARGSPAKRPVVEKTIETSASSHPLCSTLCSCTKYEVCPPFPTHQPPLKA